MCEPTTLAIAATAVSAAGQLFGGYVANQQGRYEQQVARNNQALERAAAADASDRGKRAEMAKWNEIAQTRAFQAAAMAANGFDSGFGTAADVQMDTLQLGYEDVSTIAENTQREVKGHLINAANYDAQGRAARARGRNAMIGSVFSAGGTILGGAGKIAGMNAPAIPAAGPVEVLTPFKAPNVQPLRSNPFGGITFG